MLMGLQGAGKTTLAGKLANYFRKKGKKPLLVACDVYRPAAIKQLEVVGKSLSIPVYSREDTKDVLRIAKEAITKAKSSMNDLVILDTAGRLQIDEELMNELKKIKGLEKISPELETIAKLTDKEVVTGEQSIQRDDLTEAEKNLISLIALEDSFKDVSFTSSAFTLKEGRHIQKGDRKKILIHEDLAKKNNLKLGDKISLNPAQVEGNSGQRLDYEIVGIFSGKKQEKFTGLSSDFSENTVYTDYESSQTLLGNKEAQVTAARFYLENPKDMDSIIQEVEKLSLENQGYQVEKENKAFEQIKDSVSTFQTFLQIFLYGIMIAGVGALILVLSLWLRERVYEVGILLALGKGKIAIFSQFCLEVILVSLAAILPAFVAGNAITSYLLQTVLASGDQAALQDTLAKATNLSTSLLSFGESYVFLLVISCLSVALCFIFLFRKSPKEILSSIS